jgi:hypothetical protein
MNKEVVVGEAKRINWGNAIHFRSFEIGAVCKVMGETYRVQECHAPNGNGLLLDKPC